MKDNQQLGQAIFKMSDSKRKQLFSHLLNEFRNSKVHVSGGPGSNQGYLSGGSGLPSQNISGNSSTIKNAKKKSSSIDKKNTSSIQMHSGAELKKSIPKKAKGIDYNNMGTLENSFAQNTVNKSYERLLAETIEAQNHGMNTTAYQHYQQYYGGGIAPQVKLSNNKHPLGTQNMNNMTLQISSKRGAGITLQQVFIGSANVSQTRFNAENYELVNREKNASNNEGYSTHKSGNNSHKSLSSNSKYDQQSRKRSRKSDQFAIGSATSQLKTKCESNRTSKKNSPNNTISTSKPGLNIREARTKPTSPERSLALIHGYGQPKKSNPNVYMNGSHAVNQREERRALNMISNIGKNEILSQSQVQNSSSLSQNQRGDLKSTKRKNFKNMFYSPKNNRDAFTEPHSKLPSQAHTKEHSPAQRFDNTQHIQPQVLQSHTIGHHPKIRASAKPPTQLKSKGIYSTKDSNNKTQKMENFEGIGGTNSFLEESYMKNISSYPQKRDDGSFDSSNQFSQTGTPLSYKVKVNTMKAGQVGNNLKNLNVTSQISGNKIPTVQIGSSVERKVNKVGLNAQYPYTTGMVTKNNSQAPSPTNLYQSALAEKNGAQQKPKHYRFQSEAPSPVNQKQNISELNNMKKRGVSIGGTNDQEFHDSLNQSKILTNLKQGKGVVVNNKIQNQQQFLFNQYVKTKKPRPKLESMEGSLERVPQSEQFFDAQMPKHSKTHTGATGESPRAKEVTLIKQLIKECFQKYGKPPKTQVELYKIGKMLGKGAFGRVNLGLHRLTRRLVAIKAINMEFMKDESSKKKMSNEISILKILRHPNVVKLLETFDTDKHHLIVMELCPGGDLLNYVRKRRKLNEKYAKFVFKQIMEGLAYLHQNGVVHRDIKLDNILLDGHGNIKIADFGVSRKVVDNEILFEQCGTPAYIAPEIVRELGYKGYPVDIWSAGVCLYAMLYGNVPFKANQMGDLNKMILDATIEFKDTASEEARDLMMKMLQKNPNRRLTAEDILEHSWFDDVDEHINIFDEQELDLIKKEFTYVSQKAKLKELKHRQPEDLNTEFTEHSINSSDTLMKNNSSRSVILCPFNTQAGAAAKSIYEEIVDLLIDKDMAIRFNARVREMDRQYEKFNNQDFDNGVYHKYAYNQGKNKDEEQKRLEDEALKEEIIDKNDVHNQNLVRKGKRQKPDVNYQNFYMKTDEKIMEQVEDYGFPKQYVVKCLNENVNNHCTTSYYLLCMDQNY